MAWGRQTGFQGRYRAAAAMAQRIRITSLWLDLSDSAGVSAMCRPSRDASRGNRMILRRKPAQVQRATASIRTRRSGAGRRTKRRIAFIMNPDQLSSSQLLEEVADLAAAGFLIDFELTHQRIAELLN